MIDTLSTTIWRVIRVILFLAAVSAIIGYWLASVAFRTHQLAEWLGFQL